MLDFKAIRESFEKFRREFLKKKLPYVVNDKRDREFTGKEKPREISYSGTTPAEESTPKEYEINTDGFMHEISEQFRDIYELFGIVRQEDKPHGMSVKKFEKLGNWVKAIRKEHARYKKNITDDDVLSLKIDLYNTSSVDEFLERIGG